MSRRPSRKRKERLALFARFHPEGKNKENEQEHPVTKGDFLFSLHPIPLIAFRRSDACPGALSHNVAARAFTCL